MEMSNEHEEKDFAILNNGHKKKQIKGINEIINNEKLVILSSEDKIDEEDEDEDDEFTGKVLIREILMDNLKITQNIIDIKDETITILKSKLDMAKIQLKNFKKTHK